MKTFFRKCGRCGEGKKKEDFYEYRRDPEGKQRYCKKCSAAYKRSPGVKERSNFFSRRWTEKNKERHLAKSRQWKADNKKRVKEYWKKYYAANRERLVFVATKATYVRRGAVGDFSKDNVSNLFEKQKGSCAYCFRPFPFGKYHIDHILPISRGGTNWPSNLQLTCAFCNISKKNRDRPVSIPA